MSDRGEIAAAILAAPQESNRAVGDTIGVSRLKVGKVRRELAEAGELPEPEPMVPSPPTQLRLELAERRRRGESFKLAWKASLRALDLTRFGPVERGQWNAALSATRRDWEAAFHDDEPSRLAASVDRLERLRGLPDPHRDDPEEHHVLVA